MKVSIKDLSVAMEIKTSGIELDVYSPDGKIHHGDLIMNKRGLTWCKGKTNAKHGQKIKWEDFIKWAESN
ncbi:MAG TPA: hypothetical protein VKG86_12850 [Terracidiphilus sp.]|nr:hypothetical protein [Terracidiphilus sp.]